MDAPPKDNENEDADGSRAESSMTRDFLVEPDVPLPWWVGQSQDNGYDVNSVARYEAGVFAHEAGCLATRCCGRACVPGQPMTQNHIA